MKKVMLVLGNSLPSDVQEFARTASTELMKEDLATTGLNTSRLVGLYRLYSYSVTMTLTMLLC